MTRYKILMDTYCMYILYDTNCSELWNTEVYGMMTVRTIHLSTMHEVHKTDVPPPRAKMPFIVSGRVEADRIREELFGCAAWRMKDGYVMNPWSKHHVGVLNCWKTTRLRFVSEGQAFSMDHVMKHKHLRLLNARVFKMPWKGNGSCKSVFFFPDLI